MVKLYMTLPLLTIKLKTIESKEVALWNNQLQVETNRSQQLAGIQ